MILAGGMSTRLYPLTKEVPKPLVPVAGEPNCAHLLRYLRSFGIEDVAINVHYLAEAIEAALGDGSAYGVRLHYLYEPELMGSAGAVKQLEDYFSDETFVVVGCDELTDMRLERLIEVHRERRALATLGLVHADDVSHYGVVVCDARGKIVAFQEKPAPGSERSHLVNTGIYVFEPAIFGRIPAGRFWDFGRNVFPELDAERVPFYGIEMPGAYWRDIGTPEEYRRASDDVLTGRVRLLGNPRVRGCAASARLGSEVSLEGDVRVGERVLLGDRVRIAGPSVLGDDVQIGAGALIERSIVWDRAQIGAGARLVRSIVGLGYTVAPGTALRDDIVANEPEPAAR
ncbi:MAG: sugar phosphate nucleotidyltransferase [Vulcanimicrobiaceae bacterium]